MRTRRGEFRASPCAPDVCTWATTLGSRQHPSAPGPPDAAAVRPCHLVRNFITGLPPRSLGVQREKRARRIPSAPAEGDEQVRQGRSRVPPAQDVSFWHWSTMWTVAELALSVNPSGGQRLWVPRRGHARQ